MNPTWNHEDAGSIPGLVQDLEFTDPAVALRRLVATAPIRPLAWELPYAAGAALKKKCPMINYNGKE